MLKRKNIMTLISRVLFIYFTSFFILFYVTILTRITVFLFSHLPIQRLTLTETQSTTKQKKLVLNRAVDLQTVLVNFKFHTQFNLFSAVQAQLFLRLKFQTQVFAQVHLQVSLINL